MNPTNLVFKVDQTSKEELLARAARMVAVAPPIELSPLNQSIQFLRGVNSRASPCIPAFYFFVGALFAQENSGIKQKENHDNAVAASYLEFASINTLTLSCRKAFDHAPNGLTGAKFAKISDELLLEHAQYWSKRSDQPLEDATAALKFLRRFFQLCSQQPNKLLQAETSMQKRIGLLKQHADRAAAHLSLESYEIHIFDLAHFTASLTLVGEIIRSFDAPFMGSNYFNGVDAGGHKAAKNLFPQLASPRLFGKMDITEQARGCWRFGENEGLHMLMEQIPYATSWF